MQERGALRADSVSILSVCLMMFLVCTTRANAQSLDDAHVVPRKAESQLKLASNGSAPALRQRPMRVDVDLVLVPVTVTDSFSRPVITLSKSDFALYEGTQPQSIQYFSGEDAPISVAMVLDFSASMKNKIEYERQAVQEFFNNANPEDEYFAISVSSKPKLVATSEKSIETLEAELAPITPHGGTALFDGIYLALQQLRNAQHKRKALLVISDGGDNDSRYTLKEIRSMVAESDVTMYAIGLFDDIPLPLFKTFEERWGRKWLGSITDVSGGRTIAADSRAEIPQIAAIVSRELRYQYVLGYRPDNLSRDGKWRKVTVRATLPEGAASLHVHFKEGYFAPAQ
jgi:Ca-activated chloride channel family protein